jgi:hypothetical protein
MSYFVFLSHSGKDAWVARQIAREIRDCGAVAFLDESEIHKGADFEEDILVALERASELLVLFTPWAIDRPYVWAEIGAAWGAANTNSHPASWYYCRRLTGEIQYSNFPQKAKSP